MYISKTNIGNTSFKKALVRMTIDLLVTDANEIPSLNLQNQSLLTEWHKQASVHSSYLAPCLDLAK